MQIRQGEAVVNIEPQADYVAVTTEKGTIHAKVLVGADGSRSFVRSRLKWDDESRVSRLIEVDTPENPAVTPEFQGQIAVFDFTPMGYGFAGILLGFSKLCGG